MTKDVDKNLFIGKAAFLLTLAVLSAYVWMASSNYSESGRAWPKFLALALMFAVATQLIIDLRSAFTGEGQRSGVGNEEQQPGEVEAAIYDVSYKAWFLYLAAFVLFAVSAYLFSFLLASVVFVVAFMAAHGYRKKPIALASVSMGLGVVVYLIFGILAGLPITAGGIISFSLPGL